MKLRKIGNSLGTTFGKDLLLKAGFSAEDELAVSASKGEIRVRLERSPVILELSKAEASALASGDFKSKAAQSVVAKALAAVAADK